LAIGNHVGDYHLSRVESPKYGDAPLYTMNREFFISLLKSYGIDVSGIQAGYTIPTSILPVPKIEPPKLSLPPVIPVIDVSVPKTEPPKLPPPPVTKTPVIDVSVDKKRKKKPKTTPKKKATSKKTKKT